MVTSSVILSGFQSQPRSPLPRHAIHADERNGRHNVSISAEITAPSPPSWEHSMPCRCTSFNLSRDHRSLATHSTGNTVSRGDVFQSQPRSPLPRHPRNLFHPLNWLAVSISAEIPTPSPPTSPHLRSHSIDSFH